MNNIKLNEKAYTHDKAMTNRILNVKRKKIGIRCHTWLSVKPLHISSWLIIIAKLFKYNLRPKSNKMIKSLKIRQTVNHLHKNSLLGDLKYV